MKYDVFETFKKWKSLTENEIGKTVKCHKSNNRCKYATNSLEKLVHTMEFVETSKNNVREWCVKNDEQDNYGVCKE